MYLNYFKYHVQDRNYSAKEVQDLINDRYYKHHTLSGGQHLYSGGTVSEIISTPLLAAKILLKAITIDAFMNVVGIDHITYVSEELELNPNISFTGREVTAFMNEYYDYHMSRQPYTDAIVNLLTHKYVDAEVPTNHDSGFINWDCAVLDTDYVM